MQKTEEKVEIEEKNWRKLKKKRVIEEKAGNDCWNWWVGMYRWEEVYPSIFLR